MIGKTISHYKILERLGGGGMGEVYLTEDTELERKVAIKFLPQHLTKDQENVQRFKREAKAAAALNHPNIVTIYEVSESEGQTFIAMEYVDGDSLRTKIASGISDIDEVLGITNQICEGLSEAHKADIVHRDIKPENILIDSRGRVKILDFGLAKLKGVSKLQKKVQHLARYITCHLNKYRVKKSIIVQIFGRLVSFYMNCSPVKYPSKVIMSKH